MSAVTYIYSAAAAIRRRNQDRRWFCKDKSFLEAVKKAAPAGTVVESENGFYFHGSYQALSGITARWNVKFTEV